MPRARRPDPPPRDSPDVAILLTGTALWAAAGIGLLVARLSGSGVPVWWLASCGYGIALGLLTVRYAARRRRAR